MHSSCSYTESQVNYTNLTRPLNSAEIKHFQMCNKNYHAPSVETLAIALLQFSRALKRRDRIQEEGRTMFKGLRSMVSSLLAPRSTKSSWVEGSTEQSLGV